MLTASTKRRILVAGVVTLAATLTRLYGEIQHWNPRWFGPEAGGNGALFGIAWLVPLFGIWFARGLVHEQDDRRSRLAAILWPLGGIALAAALITAVIKAMGGPSLMSFVAACASSAASATLAYRGWPALFRANLLYALTARVPILVITVIAIASNWGTHYEKMGPGSPPVSDAQRTLLLCLAQVALWIPYTVLVGGLFGGLVAGRRRA